MENIGDWLYIVILVIAGISSLFSSARKKSQQAAEQKQTPPHEITTGNSEEEVDIPAIKPQPYIKNSYQSPLAQKKFSFDKDRKGQPSTTQHDTDSMPMQAEEEKYASVTLEDLPSNTEEWRKAFIYNEIFNCKY